MSKRVKGAFTFDEWVSDEVVPWNGAEVQRNRGAKRFTGDLAGTSSIEAVMLGVDGGPKVYVAVEKYDLEFDGLKGGFVLVHEMVAAGKNYTKRLDIVPGSGTGDLAGIRGSAQIGAKHSFTLDYDLED